MPILSTIIYLFYEQPIFLVMVGATFGAFMLQGQSFVTLYMQRKRMDSRIQPKRWTYVATACVFGIQALLSVFIVYNVLFGL